MMWIGRLVEEGDDGVAMVVSSVNHDECLARAPQDRGP